MAAAREPRGRLSRRRPPPGAGTLGGRPPWSPAEGGRSELWRTLLRAVNADPGVGGEPVPPLPSWPGEEAGPGSEHVVDTEVFTVGNRSFAWTPFPPAPRRSRRSYQSLGGAGGPRGLPTPSLEGQPVPEPCAPPGPQELLSEEGSAILQSCPMCQKEFAPELTQLDVDSHLARCLAESTEEVEW